MALVCPGSLQEIDEVVYVRFLVIICLLCLLLSATVLSTYAASHEACLPTVPGPITTPPEVAGTVLINEVLLSSNTTWSCPGSTSIPTSVDNSWIELYNPMSLAFDLYGVHAALDGGPNSSPILFPFGAAIAAHGFFTFFPYQRITFPNNVETFTRRLLFNGTVIDQITIPSNLGDGQSYARTPDGASHWEITNTPTIGSSNVLPTPTPKPVPTPKRTPTPKPATVKQKSSTSKTSRTTASSKTTAIHTTATTSGSSSNPPNASSSQPTWKHLQLPTPASLLPTAEVAAVSPLDTTTTSPPANNTSSDGPRNLLFTGIAVAFVCVLLLWWRRFKHP